MARKKLGRPAQSRHDDGLAKAIGAIGSVSELAKGIGLSVQAVSQWPRVPAERCIEIEQLCGVSRYVLRPDIYGPEPPSKRVRPSQREVSRAA